MKFGLLFGLGLAVYLVSLIVNVPAAYVINLLVPGLKTVIDQPRGDVWQGAGALRLAGVPLGEIEWHTAPAHLLGGCWTLQATLAERGSSAVEICRDSWSLQDLALSLDAAALLPGLGLPANIAQGPLDVRVRTFESSAAAVGADGRVTWRDARVGLGQQVQLGDVAIRLSRERHYLRADVTNADGELGLEATAFLDSKLTYKISGVVRSTPGGRALDELGIPGERQPDGSIAIRHAGRLSQ